MIIEAACAHETSWRGQLTAEQVAELLIEGLRDLLGAPRYGLTLRITDAGDAGPAGLRPIAFVLVHDHDWHLKPSPDEGSAR